jgi:sugar lactone lactonase YvrE
MFPSTMEIDGRAPKFLNDIDIASDGTIYMSDSSIFQRRDFPLDILEGRPHGRSLLC